MSKLFLKDRVPREYDPQIWTEIVRQLQEQVNQLTEGRASAYHGSATAAPTTGDWVIGDWVKFSNPTSGGYFGAVCTVSGSPGTWKSFGLIA
jgi:hypothetical protein